MSCSCSVGDRHTCVLHTHLCQSPWLNIRVIVSLSYITGWLAWYLTVSVKCLDTLISGSNSSYAHITVCHVVINSSQNVNPQQLWCMLDPAYYFVRYVIELKCFECIDGLVRVILTIHVWGWAQQVIQFPGAWVLCCLQEFPLKADLDVILRNWWTFS